MASGVNGDHLEDAQSPVQEEWRQEQGYVIAQDLLMEDSTVLDELTILWTAMKMLSAEVSALFYSHFTPFAQDLTIFNIIQTDLIKQDVNNHSIFPNISQKIRPLNRRWSPN